MAEESENENCSKEVRIQQLLGENFKMQEMIGTMITWLRTIPDEWIKSPLEVNEQGQGDLFKIILDHGENKTLHDPGENKSQELEEEIVEDPGEVVNPELDQGPLGLIEDIEPPTNYSDEEHFEMQFVKEEEEGQFEIRQVNSTEIVEEDLKLEISGVATVLSEPVYEPAQNRKKSKQRKKNTEFKCEKCDFIFNAAVELKLHKEVKHDLIRYPCDECDFNATRSGILKSHKAYKHTNIRHQCDLCELSFTTTGNLKRHRNSVHLAIKYQCSYCDFITSDKGYLKNHKDGMHENIRYPCDQCNYVAAFSGDLVENKRSKHEDIKYPCEQCNRSFSSLKLLKCHKKRKHQGETYLCDKCEYVAGNQTYLRKHIRMMHVKF